MPKLIIGAIVILLILSIIVAKTPFLKDSLLQKMPFVSNNLLTKSIQEVKLDPIAEKKKALEEFYNEISSAQDKSDWSKIYDLAPASVRKKVTRDQFIKNNEERDKIEKAVSKETKVNSIKIEGTKGTVNRTVVTCLTKECTGDNRKEDNADRIYEFVSEKWQIPDPEPSERALKAANYGYQNSSKTDQKDLIKSFGYGSDDPTFTVRMWAVYLDRYLEELIRVETLVEQDKSEKSRPIYNQQPAQIIQQPAPIINNPAPIIQQQTSPKNCTSNTIGSYTYTNCY